MRKFLLLFNLLFLFQLAQSQIATYGCEMADTWAVSSGATSCSNATGSGDTPANQRILSGSNSWQVNNGSNTLELSAINTTGCANMKITLRVTSTSANTSNGADAGDNVKVFVNLNGGGFPATADVTLVGTSNARWGYNATLTASTTAGTPLSFAAPQGGTSTNNYSTIEVNIPAGTTSVALRISALNNDNNEIWNIDGITLSGTCTPPCTPPDSAPTSFSATSITSNSMDISWTNGNGDNTLVVARAVSAVNADPVNGTAYTANAMFGSGSQIGTGNYVVYNGTGSSVSVTGLQSNTAYHYAIYTYNSADNCYNLTELTGNALTLGPEIQLEYPVLTDVACGFTMSYGNVNNGSSSSLTFAISNDGTSDLNLTLPLTIAGTNSDQYSITSQPTSPVAPGSSTTVTVAFNPTSTGLKTANISIANNDANENPCVVNLSGTGQIVCPNVGDLVITEIMYNPSAGTESTAEYIEIYNNTANPIDLNGMVLVEGGTNRDINSSVIVPAGGYVVIGRTGSCSPTTPDFGINLGLSNSGETLSLNCNSTVIDNVPVYVGTGWPASTDGFSIQLNPNNLNATSNNTGSNWCLSTSSCGTDSGTPKQPNTSCCSISNVTATAVCSGSNALVTINFTAQGTSGTLEANVNNAGWQTITNGGNYTLIGPTSQNNNVSVLVRDVNEHACSGSGSVFIPTCPINCSGNGTLNFQMINPCGNDGQNEFITFTAGAAVPIANLAFGVTNDMSDNSFNYFWGGSNTSPSAYGCVGITSAASSYGFLDPVTDATAIAALVTQLNTAAGCSPDLFIAAPSTIPAGANVVAFLGAGAQGFDTVDPNLDFTNNCGNTYYAVFGKGTETGGYFSNSNPRLSTLDFGSGCGCVTQFNYTPVSGEPGYIFNGSSYQTGGPCVPASVIMPVETKYLNVYKKGKTVELLWATASETNNDYFTIERSGDGVAYEAIGEIKGAGNSSKELSYEFTDEKPLTGLNYYRIKQTDFDGKYSYSEVRSVRFTDGASVTVSPRTTEGRVDITTDMEDYNVEVYTAAGAQVKAFTGMNADQSISIEDLKAGIYFLRVSSTTASETVRVIKL